MAAESISASEQAVMEVLWEHDLATVREITTHMYGHHEHSLHAGVKSFLQRLMDKGFVAADTEAFAHRFRATISREEFVGRELQSMADSFFGGSLRPLLLSLVENTGLSRKDRASIQAIVERMKD
ncbi:MAG: BlaI/MecI/CopY family transcriptional regulator [Planctomycetota bacterium]